MPTVSEALAIAAGHHRAGRLRMAAEIYRRVLAAEPEHPDALHLLGVLCRQLGQHTEAETYLRKAVAAAPLVPDYHNSLGIALKAQGRFDEAEQSYGRAMELNPSYAEAASNWGNLLQAQGRWADAASRLEQALRLNPGLAEAHNSLGLVRRSQGDLDAAVALFRRALALRPEYAEAEFNLADALKEQGQLDAAIESYRRALRLRPDVAEGLNNLAIALHARGNLAEAIACYQQAVALKPDYAEAEYNLANALKDQGRFSDAVATYERVLRSRPEFPEALNNLGNALKGQGRLREANDSFRRAIAQRAEHAGAHSNLLQTLEYCPGVTLSELAEAQANFDRSHAVPLASPRGWRNARDPARRLRLGFVSADLGRHPVGYFLIAALENIDPQQAEVACYSDRAVADDLTARFRRSAALWRQTQRLDDAQLAEQVRADQVDILFDLAGHTAHNRLLMFARKPSPIAITWAGYPGATGLSAIDYVLADRYQVPAAAEPFYRHRVLRMPDSYVCYEPPDYAPEIGPLPAVHRGHVTLACFNNTAKVNPELVSLWREILLRLPGARLLLKYRGFDDPGLAARLMPLFGPAAERVELSGFAAHAELLACYNRVDIALDTHPYSGGLTTCEALWMGVPVVTCPGETFASRHSLSHLSAIGFTETVAADQREYVEIAVRLANDLPRLAAIRAGLRGQMARSPLCDGRRFADNLLAVLRQVWRDWVASD